MIRAHVHSSAEKRPYFKAIFPLQGKRPDDVVKKPLSCPTPGLAVKSIAKSYLSKSVSLTQGVRVCLFG